MRLVDQCVDRRTKRCTGAAGVVSLEWKVNHGRRVRSSALHTSRDDNWTMRTIPLILFAIAFSSIGAGVGADDNGRPAKAPDIQIQLDPLPLPLLRSPDAVLLKVLREQREMDLLTNLGIVTDRHGMATGRWRKRTLAFHQEYKLGNKRRHVFVYDPSVHMWPGTQPETIIILKSIRPSL